MAATGFHRGDLPPIEYDLSGCAENIQRIRDHHPRHSVKASHADPGEQARVALARELEEALSP